MAYWNLEAINLEKFRPGIFSKAEIGENLIMVCMEIDPDMEDTGHKHAFDQCGIVLDGQIEMFIGDDTRLLDSNETYFIPAGTQHGWKSFKKPVRLIDVSLKQ
jgi:mannose-6-phosphate isomerase-like protein (cupin superfamily)